MQKLKITEEQAKMLKSHGKTKKIKVTEAQFKKITEIMNPDTTVPSNTVTLPIFINEMMSFLKGLLVDTKSAGRTDLWEKIGSSRVDVFNAMKNIGLITIVNNEGKNEVRVLRNGIKRKLKELYNELVSSDSIEEADAPYDQPEDITNNPIQGDYKLIYFNNEIAILKGSDGLYFFYYKSIDKKDYITYSDAQQVSQGEYDDFELDGKTIQNFINGNTKNLVIGNGIDSYEAGDDLVKIDNEVKGSILNTWGPNPKLENVLSSVTEEMVIKDVVEGSEAKELFNFYVVNRKTKKICDGFDTKEQAIENVNVANDPTLSVYTTNFLIANGITPLDEDNWCDTSIVETTMAGASADGGSSGPFVTNAFFARNKGTARGFSKSTYNSGKIIGNPIDGNAGDLAKNLK